MRLQRAHHADMGKTARGAATKDKADGRSDPLRPGLIFGCNGLRIDVTDTHFIPTYSLYCLIMIGCGNFSGKPQGRIW
jgi:hypothetical protein